MMVLRSFDRLRMRELRMILRQAQDEGRVHAEPGEARHAQSFDTLRMMGF
jgi:hypothetical protein